MKLHLTHLSSRFQFPTAYQVHQMVGVLAGDGTGRPLYFFNRDGLDAHLWIQTEGEIQATDFGPWKAERHVLDIQAKTGECFGFHLRFNPSICRRGVKRDLATLIKHERDLTWDEARIEAVNAWMDKRVEHLGFRVDDVAVERCNWSKIEKPDGNVIGYSEFDVAGRLRVTDPKRFETTLCTGVGDERAFGCGLIRLYRI